MIHSRLIRGRGWIVIIGVGAADVGSWRLLINSLLYRLCTVYVLRYMVVVVVVHAVLVSRLDKITIIQQQFVSEIGVLCFTLGYELVVSCQTPV